MVAIETDLGNFHQCPFFGRAGEQWGLTEEGEKTNASTQACCKSLTISSVFGPSAQKNGQRSTQNRFGGWRGRRRLVTPASQERLENPNIQAAFYSHGLKPSKHFHSDPRLEA